MHKRTPPYLKDLAIIMILAGFTLGIYFFLPNLTGNAVAKLTTTGSNIAGIISFIMGLLGIYLVGKIKQ